MDPANKKKLDGNAYDVVIIGAGMSGLAASIRLGMYGFRTLLLERHTAPGGLNSFYRMGGHHFDVGLHALTNYVRPGVKGTPLGKIFRQLRIPREAFDIRPQARSCIRFPEVELGFTNDFEHFRSEVLRVFPHESEGFDRFTAFVRGYHAVNLAPDDSSARAEISRYLRDPLLIEMLLCPLLYYGSARENDMDFGQFAVLFQAIFLEGFGRPLDGVKPIIRTLLKRAKEVGVERKMGLGVAALETATGEVTSLLLDDGSRIQAKNIVSTAGVHETYALTQPKQGDERDPDGPAIGKLSFTESIAILDREPAKLSFHDTIVFFNCTEKIRYQRPDQLIDFDSGVICVPNNYDYGDNHLENGILRITCQASYPLWAQLSPEDYQKEKTAGYERMLATAAEVTPGTEFGKLRESIVFRDMFTPTTITRYTGHFAGAVYGAPVKIKDGTTPWKNLYLCGTDQGFLGIVGAMLSGISIVNYHILKGQGEGR